MYSDNMTKSDWEFVLNTKATNILAILRDAGDMQKKWYAFTYGLTDAQIATKIGAAQSEVTAMQTAFQACADLNNALTGSAVTTRDRKADLLPFV